MIAPSADFAHEHIDPGIRMGDSPVMLSAAKHLSAQRARPFASLRVTVEVPIDRPSVGVPTIRIILLHAIIGPLWVFAIQMKKLKKHYQIMLISECLLRTCIIPNCI
jgi:hypothetical protein